jgi:hypothetical protein
MHAISMLHRLLSEHCPSIHKKRVVSLCDVTDAAVSGSTLTLSDLGRGLSGPASIKHNIKRVDRLLGNKALHQELPQLYAALAQQHIAHLKNPVILIDWSELSADGSWQLLRASIAFEGRSVTIYEEVHPQRKLGNLRVHKSFLVKLASMLPPGCVPILVTDAGFRGSWFRLVNQMGWNWIGRIRNLDTVKRVRGDAWRGCKSLYASATRTPRCLGQFDYVRTNPVACTLVTVKRLRKGRHKRSVHRKRSSSHLSRKYARRESEPWLLAVSPGLEHLSAESVVTIYSKRMQIEEEFRDLKNVNLGLGFSANRTKHGKRLAVLLLIACLTTFLLRLIGQIAQANQMERQCQSNTRRSRPVLSLINLARQLARKGHLVFSYHEFMAALRHLRRRFCIQEI